MGKYDALLEDESDIFGGTPVSKYWDIFRQISQDLQEHEFDKIIERIAVMESMLSETHDYEELDTIIKRYAFSNQDHINELKKSLYMELAGQMIFRMAD